MSEQPHDLTVDILRNIQSTLAQHGEKLETLISGQAQHGAILIEHSGTLASHGEMLASHGEMLTTLSAGQARHEEILVALSGGQARQAQALDRLFELSTVIARTQNEHGVKLDEHSADLGAHLSLLNTLTARITRLELSQKGSEDARLQCPQWASFVARIFGLCRRSRPLLVFGLMFLGC